jgi:hypothetical protein
METKESHMPSESTNWPWLNIWKLNLESLDAVAAKAISRELDEKLERGSVNLDLSEVRFADSAGLALLIRANKRWPFRLKLANIRPALQRCLARAPAELLPEELAPSESGWEQFAQIDLSDSTQPDRVVNGSLYSSTL